MIGFPYTYGDSLSGSEAMQRRADFVDQVLVLVVCWSLTSAISHARGFPANKPIGNDQCSAMEGPHPTFAPVAGICACTSPKVKTLILLGGVAAICYSGLCSNDKTLVVACSSLATYAYTQLGK